MSQGKETLRGEEKKQNKGNHSLPPRGGLIPSLPPNNGHLRSQKYTSLHRNQTKTFFFLYLSSTLHGTEHFFGQSGSAAPAASPHNLLPTPCLLAAAAEWGKEKALTLGKGCAAIAKTLVCCQHCPATNPKHSTTAAATKKVSSIPARPSAPFNLSSQQMWWPCQKARREFKGRIFLQGLRVLWSEIRCPATWWCTLSVVVLNFAILHSHPHF